VFIVVQDSDAELSKFFFATIGEINAIEAVLARCELNRCALELLHLEQFDFFAGWDSDTLYREVGVKGVLWLADLEEVSGILAVRVENGTVHVFHLNEIIIEILVSVSATTNSKVHVSHFTIPSPS
jgi:hypothetical protein